MKLMMRMIMRFVPGKLAEGRKLLGEFLAIMNKYETFPATSTRTYTPWIGGGDAMHTIIMEFDVDSFMQMTEFFEKAWTDPELMGTMSQWDAIEESHKVELYMTMPEAPA
jgi:hypothetical protein